MTRLPDTAPLARALAAAGRGAVALNAFDTLDSTNAWFVSGAGRAIAPPAVCVTDHQPAGAGRRGRRWEALPGNLTVSLLTRIAPLPAAPGVLSLVTAIAAADALRVATSVPVSVKWPNDLVVEDSKLGGLLIESRHEPDDSLRVVGGLGINLVADPRLHDFGATTLAAHGVPASARDELLAAVVCAVFDAWDRWAEAGWASFAHDWARLDSLGGRAVIVHDGPVGSASAFPGVARGVANDGALRVETVDGVVTVYAADVSVRVRGRA